MAEERVRIFVKGVPQLNHLTFGQRRMRELGNVATVSVRARLAKGRNAYDAPAKPLSKKYARYKTKKRYQGRSIPSKAGVGRRAVRDLWLTGDMLRNWNVRTVSASESVTDCSTRLNKTKRKKNNERELWIAHSRQNIRDVMRAGRQILEKDLRPKLWTTKRR